MRYILAAVLALPLIPVVANAQTICRPSAFGGYNCQSDQGYSRITPRPLGGYRVRTTTWGDPNAADDCTITPRALGGFRTDC